jgi:hypothetical protein
VGGELRIGKLNIGLIAVKKVELLASHLLLLTIL